MSPTNWKNTNMDPTERQRITNDQIYFSDSTNDENFNLFYFKNGAS